MQSLLKLRRATRQLVTGLTAIPNRYNHFTSQAHAKESLADIEKLDIVAIAPAQDPTTGDVYFLLDYDPL
jgi:hypothetical protein